MDKYDQSADIWGLGMIIAELSLNKRHLLAYSTEKDTLSQVASLCQMHESDTKLFSRELLPHIRIDKNKSWQQIASKKKVNPLVIELVRAMLQINPENRPTINQVINHPVFK